MEALKIAELNRLLTIQNLMDEYEQACSRARCAEELQKLVEKYYKYKADYAKKKKLKEEACAKSLKAAIARKKRKERQYKETQEAEIQEKARKQKEWEEKSIKEKALIEKQKQRLITDFEYLQARAPRVATWITR